MEILPKEIWIEIISYLHEYDRYQLYLISKEFMAICQETPIPPIHFTDPAKYRNVSNFYFGSFYECFEYKHEDIIITYMKKKKPFSRELAITLSLLYGLREVLIWLVKDNYELIQTELFYHIFFCGHMNLLKLFGGFIKLRRYYFNSACSHGHVEIAKYMRELRPSLRYNSLHCCRSGNVELIELALQDGNTLDPFDIINIVKSGNREAFKKFYKPELEKEYVGQLFRAACEGRHLALVEKLHEKIKKLDNYFAIIDMSIIDACSISNNLDVIKYLISIGQPGSMVKMMMTKSALSIGAFEVIDLIGKKYVSFSAVPRKMKFFKWALENGATDWNSGLAAAATIGDISLVTLMIEKGATNLDEAMAIACEYNNANLLMYLLNSCKPDELLSIVCDENGSPECKEILERSL